MRVRTYGLVCFGKRNCAIWSSSWSCIGAPVFIFTFATFIHASKLWLLHLAVQPSHEFRSRYCWMLSCIKKYFNTKLKKKCNQTRSFPINWQLKFTLPGFHWSDVNARTPFPISRYEQYFNILSWRMKLELVKNINFQIIINIFTLWSVTLVCINRPSNLQRFGFAERGHCEIITNASHIVSQLQMLNDEKYRRNRSTNNSIRNPIINNHFDVIFLLVSFIRSLANFLHTSVATWCDMKHLLICSFLTASFHCSTICMPIFCFVPDERFEFCTHIKHSLIM